MPESAFWHDAVFAIARVCYVLYTIRSLDDYIIPDAAGYGYYRLLDSHV